MKESKYNITVLKNNEKRIIYNAMSKASIELEDKYNLSDLEGFQEEEIIFLRSNGFIIDNDDYNEKELIKYMFHKAFYEKDFLNIVLVPGLECNFKCPYCFERMENTIERTVSIETYFDRLKKYALLTFKEYKSIEISLFGGEPLLFIKKLHEFILWVQEEFSKIEIFTSIVTNGSLLHEREIRMLMDMKCKSIQITIDGYKEKHNTTRCYINGKESYGIIMNNINDCIKILPDSVTFNLRVNLDNVDVENVKSTLIDIDEKYRSKVNVLFRPIYNTVCYSKENKNKLKDLEKYYQLAKKLGFEVVKNSYMYQACESCSGENFYYIMPDLTLWKCINDLTFKEACIGKINEAGEKELYINQLIKWASAAECFDEEKCSNCKLLPDCFGGCTLYKAKNKKRSCKVFEMCSAPYMY